jgi:hypothetical protein
MAVGRPVVRDMAGDKLGAAHLTAAASSPEMADMAPERVGVVDRVAATDMPAEACHRRAAYMPVVQEQAAVLAEACQSWVAYMPVGPLVTCSPVGGAVVVAAPPTSAARE